MTCRRIGGAIVCSRSRRVRALRPTAAKKGGCRWPGCDRKATQYGWGCRAHWFRLSPDLRTRLWQTHRDEIAANECTGPAWAHVDAEAQAWIRANEEKPPRAPWRQPELPL